MRFQLFIINLILFAFIGSNASACEGLGKATSIGNKHAKFFKIESFKSGLKLEIKEALKGKSQLYFFPNKSSVSVQPKCLGVTVIDSPIKKYAASSTTYIGAFELLEELKGLVAFSNSRFVFSKQFKELKDQKKISELNFPVNKEKLIASGVKHIFSYSTMNPSIEGLDNLDKLGITAIHLSEFKEETLLARAEWIKVVALFFGKFEQASKTFSKVEKNYNKIKEESSKGKVKPLVLMGKLEGSNWVAPAKNSYIAQLVQDAGGNYVFRNWKNKRQINTSFEKVLTNTKGSRIWLPHSSWKARQDLMREDKRYKILPFLDSIKIYNNTNRLSSGGGNDFWESAVMRPDLLLEDVAKIIRGNPYSLNWYLKL